jgi:ankyrin repeat protein
MNNTDIIFRETSRQVKHINDKQVDIIKHGTLEDVKKLIDSCHYAFASYAIESGNLDVVKYLIEKADFNADYVDPCGGSCVWLAATMDQTEILDYLMDRATQMEEITKRAIFSAAVCKHNVSIAAKLFDKFGLDVHYVDKYSQDTLLHFTARQDSAPIAQFLLERGADANSKNRYDETPLQLAVSCDSLDVVEVLTAFAVKEK